MDRILKSKAKKTSNKNSKSYHFNPNNPGNLCEDLLVKQPGIQIRMCHISTAISKTYSCFHKPSKTSSMSVRMCTFSKKTSRRRPTKPPPTSRMLVRCYPHILKPKAKHLQKAKEPALSTSYRDPSSN